VEGDIQKVDLKKQNPFYLCFQIFKGQLAHNTVCSDCGAKTEEEMDFWNLPLALVKSCNKNYSVVRI